MPRKSVINVYLGILAIWMQIFAPAAAMSMERAVDPFSVICSHESSVRGDEHVPAPANHHQHCDLCQTFAGSLTLPERPAFTAFDYPVASALRWKLADCSTWHVEVGRSAQPRGPPTLV